MPCRDAASTGLGKLAPTQQLRAKYSLGAIGSTCSGVYFSSPMRPVFICAWYPSSWASSGGIHDAPCSVTTKRRPGKRSNTPPRSRWVSARREKNVVSAIHSTPATG